MPLLNATPATTGAPPVSDLPASRKALESKLPGQLKDPVNRVVTAGMKILYDPAQHARIAQIYDTVAKSGFTPQKIANGMVNLLGFVVTASKGKAPFEAIYPAGVILLTYVLEDLQKTKGLQVTDELVKTVGSLMRTAFVKAFSGNGAQPAARPTHPVAPPSAPQPLLNQGA